MKDYIEVNSAIALGLQGLGNGVKDINFKKPTLVDRLPEWMKAGLDTKKDGNGKSKSTGIKFDFVKKYTSKINLNLDFKSALDNGEKWLIRTIAGLLAFIIIYTIITSVIASITNKKINETEELKTYTQEQLGLVEDDITKIANKTNQYKDLLDSFQKLKDENNENKKWRYSIPNFLTELMYAVPKGTSIKSIVNTNGYTIRITAQAKLYSQLAYLVGSIKTGQILYDVTSSSGEKSGDYITVIIEGNLFDD